MDNLTGVGSWDGQVGYGLDQRALGITPVQNFLIFSFGCSQPLHKSNVSTPMLRTLAKSAYLEFRYGI
jgi:hypothetical protein